MVCSGKELDSRRFIYNLPSMRYCMHAAVKTTNLNEELVYTMRHFNAFHLRVGPRLLKSEG